MPASRKWSDLDRQVQRALDGIQDQYERRIVRAYAQALKEIRNEINDSDESHSKKIREAQQQKIPYMLIVGEREEKEGTVSPRNREKGDLGPQKTDAFAKTILKEIQKS